MGQWLVLALLAGVIAACGDSTSCLRGDCPAPCAKVAYTCEPREGAELYAGRVADAPAQVRLARAHGGAGDVLISNGIVTAVFADVGEPIDLAPTGGTLIDYGPAGGVDELTLIYQVAGLLPDDTFAYETLDVELRGGVARVTARGTLAGRPPVRIATHYELGPCDPGLRVRSELFNGSPDPHAFFVADVAHWGKRRVAPFAPAAGEGYATRELDLLELAALWAPYPHGAGATPAPDGAGYAAVACNAETLSGVHDDELTALGTEMKLVAPGETVVLERMLFTAGAGQGPGPAIDEALEARAQLFDTPTTQLRGRVLAGGMPFGGDVRRASIIVRADGKPLNAVVPGDDGRFDASVPRDADVVVEVWSFGRKLLEVPVEGADAGDLTVPLPASLQVALVDDAGAAIWGLVALHPADDATRAAVTGTLHGAGGECAPWLGPLHGASPACNRALIDPRGTDIEVPAGRYDVFATAGPDYTLARARVTLVEGEVTPLALTLTRLPLTPPGWLSADFHVHGRASFDSGIPDEDRVRSFVAAGVDVIAATDHDVIGDYTRAVRMLGVESEVAVMGGLEATQLVPWFEVPGEDLPRVTGHFNFWPLAAVPSAPRAGAPIDEFIEPGTLFDRLAPLVGEHGAMMLNHPWDEPESGRDLGYLRSIEFDPRVPIDDAHTLLRRPTGGHRNIDWNLIEIINGAHASELMKSRTLWHALLAQGFVTAGTGNSDSHGLTDAQLGWARNWVDAATNVGAFDAARFNRAVRDGKLSAGNGVLVTIAVGERDGARANVGIVPFHPRPDDVIEIQVRAPPWVPVEEIRAVTSRGTVVIAEGFALLHAQDPFGDAGTLRYHGFHRIADLVEGDDFLIIEAGLPYPPAADLDDDGIVDTSDNDGDGDADRDDIDGGEDAGPLSATPDPTDPADERWPVTRVVPGAWPEGFANPVLVDVDGDGWEAPGLP